MKKPFTLLLMGIALLLTLAACSNNSPSVNNANAPADPQSEPLNFLEAAGEKLKSADSFEVQAYEWFGYLNDTTPYSKENEYLRVQMQYASDVNGTPASYLQWRFYSTKQDTPYLKWFYFHGETGFSGDFDEGAFVYSAKHLRDQPFTPAQHFVFFEYGLDLDSTTMFDNFCKFPCTVTTGEDGSTTIAYKGLSDKEVANAMGVQHPLFLGWNAQPNRLYSLGIGFAYVNENQPISYSYGASFSVDSAGYLSEIRISRYLHNQKLSPEPVVQATISLVFSHINETLDIQESGYSNQFRVASDIEHPKLYHHFGPYHTAQYNYDSTEKFYYCWAMNYICTETMNFNYPVTFPLTQESMTQNSLSIFEASEIHSYHTILPQIDGIPVKEVYNTAGTDIDGLVIPKGVCVGLYGETGAAGGKMGALFFEDTEEAVYALAKATISSNYHITCPAYFAGQWEYIDGVPTPKQSVVPEASKEDPCHLLYGDWYHINYDGGSYLSESLYTFREDGTCSSGGNNWQECTADSSAVDMKAFDKYWELCGGGGKDYTYTYDGSTVSFTFQSGTGPSGESYTQMITVDGDTMSVYADNGVTAYTRGNPDWASTNTVP